MFFRIILIVLVLNLVAAAVVLWSRRSRREKFVWTIILAAIPLALWIVYRMFQGKENIANLKDWESR